VEYTVKVEEVLGGIKVELLGSNIDMDLIAVAAKSHQIPHAVKGLLEIVYPKPEKKEAGK